MRRYKNLGTPIEVQIKDEYSVVAFINLIDRKKSEYRCDLHIRDNESGLMMEIDKSATLTSDLKSVKVNVTAKLSQLIDNGYFDDDVQGMKNVYDCLIAHSSYSTEE